MISARIPTTIPFTTAADITSLSLSPMTARTVEGNAKDGTIKVKKKQVMRFLMLIEYDRVL